MPDLARAPRQLTIPRRRNMCLTASCLAHRRRVFYQCWPPEDAGTWRHTDNWLCAELAAAMRRALRPVPVRPPRQLAVSGVQGALFDA